VLFKATLSLPKGRNDNNKENFFLKLAINGFFGFVITKGLPKADFMLEYNYV